MKALGNKNRHRTVCLRRFSFGILFILCLCLSIDAHAQIGNCPASEGDAYLDAGNVRARIPNNGGLFYRGEPSVYEVPKGSGIDAIYRSNIWIAGKIGDEIRGSAAGHSPWEMWAGPLDEEGKPPEDCSVFDRVWEIRKSDISAYLDSAEISANLANWPWVLGAPVVDGDGNPNNYNLEGGDLPDLLGDQRLWWIMNDRGNIHESSQSEPIGLEVHASAHAFSQPEFLSNATFYEYRLINKNPAPFTDGYFGIYSDVDVGFFNDDYLGSDSLLHLAFVYNADNEDEGDFAYGVAPPAIGFTFLETIVADSDALDNDRDGDVDEPGEKLGATGVLHYFHSGGPEGDPEIISDYYNYMIPRWKDGAPILEGLHGSGRYSWPDNLPRKKTNFFYSGDPVTRSFWSELNTDDLGTANDLSDTSFLTSTGPFSIAPMDTVNIRFAIVWSRGNDHLDSVTQLKKDVDAIRRADAFQTPTAVEEQPSSPPGYLIGFDQNFPNPFSESTTIRYSLPKSMQVRLVVFDLLGREVSLLVESQQNAGVYTVTFDAERLPPGMYLARLELDHLRFVKRMVLIR